MGLPVVQVVPLRYGKIGQQKNKDLSGCREEYARAGIKRGEHMKVLYGDMYDAMMTNKSNSIMSHREKEAVYFKHILTPFKLGVIVYDMEAIKACFKRIIRENAPHTPDKTVIKTKRKKG